MTRNLLYSPKAGYRRMSELCTFLEKRHTEVQKTLDEYRKSALLTSLAEQCAAGDAAGAEGAVLDGKIILMRKVCTAYCFLTHM